MKERTMTLRTLLMALMLVAGAGCGKSSSDDSDAGTDDGCSGAEVKLVINEVQHDDLMGGPDWVELYNGDSCTINLTLFRFSDDKPNNRAAFEEGSTIAPQERKVIELSATWPGFRLGPDEQFELLTQTGERVDFVDWTEPTAPKGSGYARIPDASEQLDAPFKAVKPTRGQKNEDQAWVP